MKVDFSWCHVRSSPIFGSRRIDRRPSKIIVLFFAIWVAVMCLRPHDAYACDRWEWGLWATQFSYEGAPSFPMGSAFAWHQQAPRIPFLQGSLIFSLFVLNCIFSLLCLGSGVYWLGSKVWKFSCRCCESYFWIREKVRWGARRHGMLKSTQVENQASISVGNFDAGEVDVVLHQFVHWHVFI